MFHWKPDLKSYNQITLHFLLHGLHHKTPMDGDRLVFPPTPALLIIGFFYVVYRSLLAYPVFCCFASGKLFGYICYDVSHYYLHHGNPAPKSNMHFRKVYHHNHHFKNHNLGYGISTVLWDYVSHIKDYTSQFRSFRFLEQLDPGLCEIVTHIPVVSSPYRQLN